MNIRKTGRTSGKKRNPAEIENCNGIVPHRSLCCQNERYAPQKPPDSRQGVPGTLGTQRGGKGITSHPWPAWLPPNANDEFQNAVRAIEHRHFRELAKAGITDLHIKQLPFGKIGVVRARLGDGFYKPVPMGIEVFVVPAFYSRDRIIDLVAFHLEAPIRFWVRFGVATFIGNPMTDILATSVIDLIRNGTSHIFRLDCEVGNG